MPGCTERKRHGTKVAVVERRIINGTSIELLFLILILYIIESERR